MSKQNLILILVGLAVATLYVVEFVAQHSGLPHKPELPDPLWHIAIGVLLILAGAFGIEKLTALTLNLGSIKAGFRAERYEPSDKEVKQAIESSADSATPEQAQREEVLVKKAHARGEDNMSAADFLVLSTNQWRSENFDAAVSLAHQGLSLRSADVRLSATLKHRLASAYEGLAAMELAERLYRQAIAEDPDFSWPRNNLGILLAATGRTEEAEKEYREAIALDPKYALAHYNLGVLLVDAGRTKEAEKEYREAIALNLKYASAHNNLGILLKDTGRTEEAEKEYRKAIALDPTHASAHNNLGNLLKDTGRTEEAEKEYREARRLKEAGRT